MSTARCGFSGRCTWWKDWNNKVWSGDLRPNDQLTGSYCWPEVGFWDISSKPVSGPGDERSRIFQESGLGDFFPHGRPSRMARLESPSTGHLRSPPKRTTEPVGMAHSEELVPTKANAFLRVKINSLAECGRMAALGLRARSKNRCHSAGASGK
jgi:hypothetical protein